MTNGEKFKEVFGVSQVDEGELYAYVWLPNHDAAEFSIDWWNAEYKEPTTKNDLGVDCISRADAIQAMQDTAKKLTNEDIINGLCGAVAILFDLPSVTPKEPQTFKWCTDCKEYDQEKHCCHRWSKVIRDTVEEMKQEQEPKIGHWIPTYGNVECSVCGSVKDSREVGKATHYCDFCGAKMVEPQESEE